MDRQKNTCKSGKTAKTFDEFFSCVYMPHAETRKRSWQIDARLARRHISAFFGARRLDAISAPDVEKWLGCLRAKGLAPATCNRILAVLKSAFFWAETAGYIPALSSPCRHVRPLKVIARRERFLSESEGQKLMQRLRNDNSMQAKAIQLLLLTGARKSEILHARWDDLDCERRILTVPIAKSGHPRHIYLSGEAVAVFKSIGRQHDSPWIFPGRKPDKPLSSLYAYWDKTRLSLGLAGVRLHDLRHSFASYLVSSGHTLYEAQQLLGHADPRTTMRYAHFAHDALVRASASVARVLVKNEFSNATKEGRNRRGRVALFVCKPALTESTKRRL